MSEQLNTTESPPAKETSVVGKLGLRTDIFAAQLLNFVVLLVILWRFVYRPLMKVMNERTEKIEQGMKDAAEAANRIATAEADYEKRMQDAQLKAAVLIKSSEERAERRSAELLEKARVDVAKLVSDAKEKIVAERAIAQLELKQNIATLVARVAEVVLQEKLDGKKDTALMERAIESVYKNTRGKDAAHSTRV